MAERKERPCERSLSSSTTSSAPKWVLICRRYFYRRNIADFRNMSPVLWFTCHSNCQHLLNVLIYCSFQVVTCQHVLNVFDLSLHLRESKPSISSLLVESIIWFNNILFKFYAILFLFLGMLMSIYSHSLHKNISSFSLYFFKYTNFLSFCLLSFCHF